MVGCTSQHLYLLLGFEDIAPEDIARPIPGNVAEYL